MTALPKQMQAGVQNVTVNTGTGEPAADGTEDVTFDIVFQKIPTVVLSLNEALTTGKEMTYLAAISITRTGFTIDWESNEDTKADLDIGWIAMERGSTEKAGQ